MSLIDPLGQTEWYVFNKDKVLIEHIDTAGAITKTDVDGRGSALMQTDAGGRRKLMTYDLWGKTTSVTDAAGYRTEIMYGLGVAAPRLHC